MATTDDGVAPVAEQQENHFQQLYEAGAFEEPGSEQAKDNAAPAQGAEPEQQAESVDEPEVQEQEASEEPRGWSNLDEFLSENELDPDDFKSIPVSVKIDGETRNVPLSDVIKSYQLEGHVNNKSIELSNQQREFEQQRQQELQKLQQQQQQTEQYANYLQQQINSDFQNIDWNRLREEDPAEASSKWMEFQQRQAALNQYVQYQQQVQQQQAQQQQQEQQQSLAQERERLLDAIPGWRDPEQFKKDSAQITSYAKHLGFSDAEISQVADHRLMQVLHDAARYQQLQASKPTATKRVREAPKMAKPGTRNPKDPQGSALASARERFQRNPSDLDVQADYFSHLV